jgi:RNA polymerase sigma-54 factor
MLLELVQKQTNELIMTAKISQAIGLLQYNNVDLLQFIQEQATENPLIALEEQELGDSYKINHYVKPIKRQAYGGEDCVNPIDYAADLKNESLDDALDQIMYLEIDEAQRNIIKY